MRTRVLSLHADYGCRHTGACCSSGWDIPVEPRAEGLLREALRDRRLRVRAAAPSPFREEDGLPHGARVVLRHDEAGRCVFLESGRGNLCAIHRQVGEGALPSACRDFPRTVTRTPLGVSITLSHYCPTAAGLLFRSDPPLASAEGGRPGVDPWLRIVTDPPAFPPGRAYEGLEARDALPPLLRPGVLASWEALRRFEEHAVSTLARDELSPEGALATLRRLAERARAWTPADGPFDPHFERCLDEPEPAPLESPRGEDLRESLQAWSEAAASVPAAHPLPPPPARLEDDAAIDRARILVDAGWRALSRPIRRWLAGRAFASWLALQGEGLRTTVAGLEVALGVLGAEAARGCLASGAPLDADALREAIRRSDLLLVHLTDPVERARRLSRGEVAERPTPPW